MADHRSFPERPAAELHCRPYVGFTCAHLIVLPWCSCFRPVQLRVPCWLWPDSKRDHLAAKELDVGHAPVVGDASDRVVEVEPAQAERLHDVGDPLRDGLG